MVVVDDLLTSDETKRSCSPRSRRRVHFQSSDNENNSHIESGSAPLLVEIIGARLTPASEMSDEDVSVRWYLQHEYARQKWLARCIADDISSREPEHGQGGYIGTISRVYHACLGDPHEPSSEDLERLHHWTRVAHSRRGLEQWSVSAVSRQRKIRRFALKQTLLHNQKRLSHLNAETKAEVLRLCSLQFSKAASRFATAMADADALAVDNPKQKEASLASGPSCLRRFSLGPSPCRLIPS